MERHCCGTGPQCVYHREKCAYRANHERECGSQSPIEAHGNGEKIVLRKNERLLNESGLPHVFHKEVLLILWEIENIDAWRPPRDLNC